MKSRLLLALAVVCGSLAGFLVSEFIHHEIVSPIVASPDQPHGSISYLFSRRWQDPPHRLGKNDDQVKEPFRSVVANANASTVRLRVDGKQVALGVVVHRDGLVLSKLSELEEELQCAIPGGRVYDATIVARDADTDLALVRIAKSGLTPARWSDRELVTGSWVAVPSGKGQAPLVIGVVSAPAHDVPGEKAALGVSLSNSASGPMIDYVIPNSIAARIGLTMGDVIRKIDEQPMNSSDQLITYLQELRPGARVRLDVVRDGKSMALDATLGHLSEIMAAHHGMEEDLNRELSIRRSGFPRVLQHDCIVPSQHCGGPLVDLEGKIIGLNIARSGRISTYTLPTSVVREVLPRLLRQAGLDQLASRHDTANNASVP